jgi:hypothetical protein
MRLKKRIETPRRRGAENPEKIAGKPPELTEVMDKNAMRGAGFSPPWSEESGPTSHKFAPGFSRRLGVSDQGFH